MRASVSSHAVRPSARNGLRAEPDRSEIEDAVTYAEPDPRRVAVDGKDSEADPSRHNGSTPIASSSSTGSKKLQLPIE